MKADVGMSKIRKEMRSVELFTGCGGLAMGLSRAGFKPLRMSEWDKHSVLNVQHNRKLGLSPVSHWPIFHEDVRSVEWSKFAGVDLVAGGPPCQPFSIGGRHRGDEDSRDMWPEAVRAVREINPSAFLFENVRGLLRPAFGSYLRWVLLSLSLPQIERMRHESINDHLSRLERSQDKFAYHVQVIPVNAADYGAPQKRHRVIIVGIHRGLNEAPTAPPKTHTRERLLWDKWITGEYWYRHGLRRPKRPPPSDAAGVERLLQHSLLAPNSKPWATVRDAIAGLGEPDSRSDLSNHIMQAGARSYVGHTGSVLDEPAKALKAGVHGVPGGENMMAFENGKVRYFTVREAARLQGLPDDYEFVGSWTENMRQLGNAVPAPLAEAFAKKIVCYLSNRPQKSQAA
jgi:DNA (cytosine-5)-methyltransferase 1